MQLFQLEAAEQSRVLSRRPDNGTTVCDAVVETAEYVPIGMYILYIPKVLRCMYGRLQLTLLHSTMQF